MTNFSYKNSIAAVVFFCAGFLMQDNAVSQPSASQEGQNPLKVYFKSFPSETEDKIRVVVLIQVGYNDIRFLKKNDMFIAEYEFSVDILDAGDNIAAQKYWEHEFKLHSFDETIDRDEIFLETLEFELEPGFYKYFVEMTDSDSKRAFHREDSKIFPAYWDDIVGFSDVVLSRGTEEKPLFDNFVPSSGEMEIDYNEGFEVQMQLFSRDLQPIEFSWEIMNFFDDTEILMSESMKLEPDKHTINISIPITGELVPPGTYLLQGRAVHPSGKKDEMLHRFKVAWMNRPKSSYDPELSLKQMRHILSHEDNQKIQRMTENEKPEFFKKFWKEQDLTPDTEKNELMEEYFQRVDYANRNFSFSDQPGWGTDRGKIYCIFGKPDKGETVKRRYYYSDTRQRAPQIVWTYYKAKRIFIFDDRDGTGKYKLISEEVIR